MTLSSQGKRSTPEAVVSAHVRGWMPRANGLLATLTRADATQSNHRSDGIDSCA